MEELLIHLEPTDINSNYFQVTGNSLSLLIDYDDELRMVMKAGNSLVYVNLSTFDLEGSKFSSNGEGNAN